MECVEPNTYIITLSVQTHGVVTEFDLSPRIRTAFENVRLFSNVGTFKECYLDSGSFSSIARQFYTPQSLINLSRLNGLFRKNLNNVTARIFNEYAIEYRQIYQNKLKGYPFKFTKFLSGVEYGPEEIEKACRAIPNIFFDKIFSINEDDNGAGEGIFLVSVHRKINDNNYELVFPPSERVPYDLMELENLISLAAMFNPRLNLTKQLRSISRDLDHSRLIELDKQIKKAKSEGISDEENLIIEGLIDEGYELHKNFIMTIKNDNIITIKFSILIELLKAIFGSNSNYNIFDYTCNYVSTFVPAHKQINIAERLEESVVPSVSETWGGEKYKKYKKYTKNRKYKKYSRKRNIKNKFNKSIKKFKLSKRRKNK